MTEPTPTNEPTPTEPVAAAPAGVDPVGLVTDTGADPSPAEEPTPGSGHRRAWIVAAAIAVVLTLAVAGLARPRTTEAAVSTDGGALASLAYEEPTTTTTAPPETTTTTEAPPETTTTGAPTSTAPVTTYPRPARPKVTYPNTVSQVAAPTLQGTVWLRNAPGGGNDISFNNPRQIGDDPNALVPLVFLVKQDRGAWLEVYVPSRPNGRTAWIAREDVDVTSHKYRIEVYLQEFRLRVFDGPTQLVDIPVGVAKASTPTPVGIFYTTELVRPVNAGGPYGPYAFGLSGFSDVLMSFGGGPGQLGIHGTNQPGLIGQEVSSGCVRLRNQDITHLAGFIPLGTPVIINDRY